MLFRLIVPFQSFLQFFFVRGLLQILIIIKDETGTNPIKSYSF